MNSDPAAKTSPPPMAHDIAPAATPTAAQASMARQWARQESAMHCVRLAVQRWRTGYVAADATVPSSQERWFAEVHGHFTAWLTAGGFAQHGTDAADAPENIAPAPAAMTPPMAPPTAAPFGPALAAAHPGAGTAHENSGTKPPFPCPA